MESGFAKRQQGTLCVFCAGVCFDVLTNETPSKNQSSLWPMETFAEYQVLVRGISSTAVYRGDIAKKRKCLPTFFLRMDNNYLKSYSGYVSQRHCYFLGSGEDVAEGSLLMNDEPTVQSHTETKVATVFSAFPPFMALIVHIRFYHQV